MMPSLIEGLDVRLRETLERLQLNRRQAAAHCGCTGKQMSAWCTGSPMATNSVKAVCDGLGISADYLLGTKSYLTAGNGGVHKQATIT